MDGFAYGALAANRANARDADAAMAEAQLMYDALRRENDLLRLDKASLALEANRREACVAGLSAQAKASVEALREAAPDHPLLALTGRTFESGPRPAHKPSEREELWARVARVGSGPEPDPFAGRGFAAGPCAVRGGCETALDGLFAVAFDAVIAQRTGPSPRLLAKPPLSGSAGHAAVRAERARRADARRKREDDASRVAEEARKADWQALWASARDQAIAIAGPRIRAADEARDAAFLARDAAVRERDDLAARLAAINEGPA